MAEIERTSYDNIYEAFYGPYFTFTDPTGMSIKRISDPKTEGRYRRNRWSPNTVRTVGTAGIAAPQVGLAALATAIVRASSEYVPGTNPFPTEFFEYTEGGLVVMTTAAVTGVVLRRRANKNADKTIDAARRDGYVPNRNLTLQPNALPDSIEYDSLRGPKQVSRADFLTVMQRMALYTRKRRSTPGPNQPSVDPARLTAKMIESLPDDDVREVYLGRIIDTWGDLHSGTVERAGSIQALSDENRRMNVAISPVDELARQQSVTALATSVGALTVHYIDTLAERLEQPAASLYAQAMTPEILEVDDRSLGLIIEHGSLQPERVATVLAYASTYDQVLPV